MSALSSLAGLGFNPHLHILATDGCFINNETFIKCFNPDPKKLEKLFRYELFKMLKKEGKINDFIIENMMSWHYSGFNIYCGDPIDHENETGLEKIARYIVRASFSQERMRYIPESKSHDGIAKVIYSSKNGKIKKIFTALDWLAMLTNHIPNKGQQMIRYYGTYSNKKRGMRKKQKTDEQAFELIESNDSPKKINKNWARLIQKIYNVDPLICTKCQKEMRVVSFIEEHEIIKKILKHLGLWDLNNHDPPLKKVTNIPEFIYDYSYSQII